MRCCVLLAALAGCGPTEQERLDACLFPSIANFRSSMTTPQGQAAVRLLTSCRDRANALRRELGQPPKPAPREEPFCTEPERDARKARALAGAR